MRKFLVLPILLALSVPAAAQQLTPGATPDYGARLMSCLSDPPKDVSDCYGAALLACSNAGVFEICLEALATAMLDDAGPDAPALDTLREVCAAEPGMPNPACIPDRAFAAWAKSKGI